VGFYQILKARGQAASDHYAGSRAYFDLTPASVSLLKVLDPALRDYCRGRVLDAGAGRGAYRELLQNYADSYVGMDIAPSKATAAVGDVQCLPFAANSFDTVFCSQVLEHVPEPGLSLQELMRVLKPGGYLVLSVPHLSWLHNEPHDYFRFTIHGIRFLFDRAGFVEQQIVPAGGLLSFLGHIPSTLWVNFTYGVPVLHRVVCWLNRLWCRGFAALDAAVEKKKVFALNYVAVGQKKQGD
jgi:SAM-dependent methyltransferase